MEDEENQIRGFVHFADGQGVGFAYLTLFTIKEAVRIVKNGEASIHKSAALFIFHPVHKSFHLSRELCNAANVCRFI